MNFMENHMMKKKTGDCDKYIYKLIPEAKAEIDKLVKSGIY